MKFKKVLNILSFAMLTLSCSEATDKIGIMQNGQVYSESEITIEKKPFTLSLPHKDFAFVMATKPIKILNEKQNIITLVGTGVALAKGDAPLYKKSDILDDYNTCTVYYGNLNKGCESYIRKKVELGLKDSLVYTFGAFYIEPKEWLVERINEVKIDKTESNVYYLYLFEERDKLTTVATVQNITRIKINMR